MMGIYTNARGQGRTNEAGIRRPEHLLMPISGEPEIGKAR
jgi:hypothetical protein